MLGRKMKKANGWAHFSGLEDDKRVAAKFRAGSVHLW